MHGRSIPLLMVGVLMVGCAESAPGPTEAVTASTELFAGHSLHHGNYKTHLSGREEVPPADTRAQGQFHARLSDDGQSLHFKLIVANIRNVTQAHFHWAAAGENGPVVAWLYPSGPPPQLIPGRYNGPLAEGVITSDDLVGPLAGASLADLLEEIRAGMIYVNVHTSQFPGGEVRGQLK
jgi:hypothetical protein